MRGDPTMPQAAGLPRAADFRYDVDAQWEKLPAGISHRDVSAVGTDSVDRVYLLTRYDSNVLVYEPDGTFITAWGGAGFTHPRGPAVGPGDSGCTADRRGTTGCG